MLCRAITWNFSHVWSYDTLSTSIIWRFSISSRAAWSSIDERVTSVWSSMSSTQIEMGGTPRGPILCWSWWTWPRRGRACIRGEFRRDIDDVAFRATPRPADAIDERLMIRRFDGYWGLRNRTARDEFSRQLCQKYVNISASFACKCLVSQDSNKNTFTIH